MGKYDYQQIIYHLVEFTGYTFNRAVWWMHTSNSFLGDKKPEDLIDENRAEEVWNLVKSMGEIEVA